MNLDRLHKAPLALKMALVALPMAIIALVAATQSVSTYQRHSMHVQPQTVTNSPLKSFAVLDEMYTPPPGGTTGTYPTYPPPDGGTYTPPPSGTQPVYQQPTQPTAPPPAGSTTPPPTGTAPTYPPPPTGGDQNTQPYNPTGGTTNNYQPPTNGSSPTQNTQNSGQPTAQQLPPPMLTINNPNSCIETALGADAANKFKAGTLNPTPEQMAKVNSAGCFSARVSYGSPPSGAQNGINPNGAPGQPGGAGQQASFSSIAIAPPPQFQQDSPMMSCAKGIMGDKFGQTPPTAEQMEQLKSKCFAQAGNGPQFGPPGQGGPANGQNSGQNGQPGTPPPMPPELKACVVKAGISETAVTAIQHGQSPTAEQQQKGEACFKKYAEQNGISLPMLTPPDPTQPFDPNSKQNQCADLVAQTHGLRFNQINPKIVSTWSPTDVAQLRSCYGVAAPASGSGGIAFAPNTTQVAVSSSKLACIEEAMGADKLAAIIAGTGSLSNTERKTVYNKCINPTKIAAGADPALLGVMSAMPPSDLEGQFIPVDPQQLPTPSASGVEAAANGQVVVNGEVNVTEGETLPTKVDVFVKSTPQTFTVSLTKVSATKATWTVKMAQNKLALGGHEAYAVATLDDATQLRSPDGDFKLAAAKTPKKSSLPVIIAGISATVAALSLGTWIAWRWHAKKSLLPFDHTQTQ